MLFAALCLRLRPNNALLASRLPPAVDADAHAPALLASRLFPAVDADAAAPALLALRLPPAVDADAHAPALLASRLPPAVDANAHATALFTFRLPPAVDADAHAPALLASRLLPAVDADADATALLATRLLPAMDADADAPALLAYRLPPAVDADAHAPTLLALRLLPRVDAHRCTTTTRLASRPSPIMQARGFFSLHFAVLALRLPKVVGLWRCLVWADSSDAALSQSVLSAQIRLRGPVSQGHRIAFVIRHLVHPYPLCRHFPLGCFCEGQMPRNRRDPGARPVHGGRRPDAALPRYPPG
jgi:hypothetical protein